MLGQQSQRAPRLADPARGSDHRTCSRTVQEGDLPQIYDNLGLSTATGGREDGVSVDSGGDVQFTGSRHHGGTRSNEDGADGWHFRFLSRRDWHGFRASIRSGKKTDVATGMAGISTSAGQCVDRLQSSDGDRADDRSYPEPGLTVVCHLRVAHRPVFAGEASGRHGACPYPQSIEAGQHFFVSWTPWRRR